MTRRFHHLARARLGRSRLLALLVLAGWWLGPARAFAQDTNFWVFLCFGQSNMEGFPGLEEQDRQGVDPRFQVLATVDFPAQGRQRGHWYPAEPPLCRPGNGLGPADYFGRTLVARLPAPLRVGVVNVAVAGGRIELFDPATLPASASNAPPWMKRILEGYGGDPYRHLVEAGRRASRDGVIKGILLHQGESNPNDREWPAKVKRIYDRLLQDLQLRAADVPLLAGELVAADQQGACAGMNRIIATLPATIPTALVVAADGCAGRPDHLHFAPAGYRELGRRYAEALLNRLGLPSRESR